MLSLKSLNPVVASSGDDPIYDEVRAGGQPVSLHRSHPEQSQPLKSDGAVCKLHLLCWNWTQEAELEVDVDTCRATKTFPALVIDSEDHSASFLNALAYVLQHGIACIHIN